jgi:hypothetical protein
VGNRCERICRRTRSWWHHCLPYDLGSHSKATGTNLDVGAMSLLLSKSLGCRNALTGIALRSFALGCCGERTRECDCGCTSISQPRRWTYFKSRCSKSMVIWRSLPVADSDGKSEIFGQRQATSQDGYQRPDCRSGKWKIVLLKPGLLLAPLIYIEQDQRPRLHSHDRLAASLVDSNFGVRLPSLRTQALESRVLVS